VVGKTWGVLGGHHPRPNPLYTTIRSRDVGTRFEPSGWNPGRTLLSFFILFYTASPAFDTSLICLK